MPAAHPDAPLNLPAILIANGLGIYLLLVLLFSKRHPARPRTLDGRLFYGMCWLNLALCVVETLSFMLDGTLFWGARALAILANCLLFFSTRCSPLRGSAMWTTNFAAVQPGSGG